MSRLCVKNLPKYVREDRLREFFSQKGEVTDAKIMRTKDGKSRQFAFIGFRTEKEAEEALKHFNSTFMDTCKITCEVAHKVGDPNIPRPWSRHSLKDIPSSGNTENKTRNRTDKGQGLSSNVGRNSKGSDVDDPKFQEFLKVMQPRDKSKLWANDTVDAVHSNDQRRNADEKRSQKKHSAPLNDQPINKNSMENELTKNLPSEETTITQSPEREGDDLLTDIDYFRSKIKKNWSDTESDDEDSIVQTDVAAAKEESSVDLQEASDVIHEKVGMGEESTLEDSDHGVTDSENPTDEKKLILDTGRLFARNLPYTATEDELLELFSQFGDVSHVHLVVDQSTKRSKGIAYVLFTLPESAVRAYEELDKSIFQGRLLHVMPAKPQKNNKLESDHATIVERKTFKQQREDQRKASEASGDTRAWNSLFMRPDTVVENIARKNGISKSELLDREADDLAVRIALGETHIIAETKKALSRAGINVVALEEYAAKKRENFNRSNHVILVKNLPYGSSEGDISNMFGKFGSLDKVILPPTKALALVVFLEAAEARLAFKGLAYKRYKDAPLYLEWAPENILSPTPALASEEQQDVIGEKIVRKVSLEPSEEQQHVIGEKIVKKVLLEQSMEGPAEDDIDPDRVESRSVFVKNLNFKTSDESLKEHLSNNTKDGTIKSVKVKKHLKNGKNVSMGFGFVEFDSVETATNVCRDLQGTVLDGHALILQLCRGKRDAQAAKKDAKDRSSTKLIVRNVAFEATEKDLRQLFSPFGQVKSLRLPMKFGSHRGFAFVEFVTKQEAQNALQALSNTHLYGRHLVIERAKEGESLEELRARTAAQFVDEHNGFQKLSKKRKQMSLVDEGTVKFSRILD